jgi:hypothetical protein
MMGRCFRIPFDDLPALFNAMARTATDQDVIAIRRALCAPAVPGMQLFPPATELLAGLKGVRDVVR